MEPRRSCSQSRQSNETDSVNAATSAAGPPAKRPPRETGALCFVRFTRDEFAAGTRESHAGKAKTERGHRGATLGESGPAATSSVAVRRRVERKYSDLTIETDSQK